MEEFAFSGHKVVSVIEKTQGTTIIKEEYMKRRINRKDKGYNLVYMQEVFKICKLVNTSQQVYIILDLLKTHATKDLELYIDYSKICKIYKISVSTSQKILSFMKKNDVIRGSRGKYIVSPLIILPKAVDDEHIVMLQKRWKEGYGKKC